MASFKKRVKNTLIYWTVLYLILFIRQLSRQAAFIFFRYLAILAFHLARSEREKTIRHLTLAFGKEKDKAQIHEMARQVFIDLGKNAADAILMSLFPGDELKKLVHVEGLEHLKNAQRNGKGTIFVTGHIGCWELLTRVLPMYGFEVYPVGKPLYDPRLDRLLVRNRESGGARNIARGNSIKLILRALRKNAVVGILIDQDTNVDGVFVDFFSEKAYTPIGPVVLAMKTGAVLIPGAIQMLPDHSHRIIIGEPVELILTGDRKKDLINNTQKLSDFLEETIRLYPTQWVWMHERWKTRPEQTN